MEDEEFFVNKFEIDKSAKIPSSDNLRSQLPLHMQDLYERSITNLDKKDHHDFFLLNRFQHVFAENDFDLGLFNGEITHKKTLTKQDLSNKSFVEHQWVLKMKKRVTLIKCFKKV